MPSPLFSPHVSPYMSPRAAPLFDPRVPPIDPLTVDYWDGDHVTLVSGAINAWRGRMTGASANAPSSGQRMNYVTDIWNGRAVRVAQGTSGGRGLGNSALGTPLASIGERPYIISAYRPYGALPGSAFWGVFGLGVNATSDPLYIAYQAFGGSELRPTVVGVNVFATALADQLPHVTEAWADGTNSYVRDNGVLYQVANTGALSANMTAFGIGRGASGNYHYGNLNHGFHMLCRGKPSELFIGTLKAWLHYTKGAPLAA